MNTQELTPKRARALRMAETRVNAAVDKLRLVGALTKQDLTEAEKAEIVAFISKEYDSMLAKFQPKAPETKPVFALTPQR